MKQMIVAHPLHATDRPLNFKLHTSQVLEEFKDWGRPQIPADDVINLTQDMRRMLSQMFLLDVVSCVTPLRNESIDKLNTHASINLQQHSILR